MLKCMVVPVGGRGGGREGKDYRRAVRRVHPIQNMTVAEPGGYVYVHAMSVGVNVFVFVFIFMFMLHGHRHRNRHVCIHV